MHGENVGWVIWRKAVENRQFRLTSVSRNVGKRTRPPSFVGLGRRPFPPPVRAADKLLGELQDHPKTGTGKPEALSGDRSGQWSRRISQKHRLIYEIKEEIVNVAVLSSYGHYED